MTGFKPALGLLLSAGVVTGGASGSALSAQNRDTTSWQRFEEIARWDAWLQSDNAAGLVMLPPLRMSWIALSAVGERGSLRDDSDAEGSVRIGAGAGSCLRAGNRTTLCGGVQYDRFSGQGMSGSYFIDPQQTPFDLVEYTTDNPGRKQLERYRLSGAAGYALNRRFAAGIRCDYATANYAKRKDLRHINSLLDLEIGPALLVRIGPHFALGVNYAYRRRVESLLLQVYGKTDRVYESLLDYGARFGKREVFGENGYTKENEAKPLFDRYHGAALQLDWRPHRGVSLFGQVAFRTRKGYYGRPSPSTIVYSNHSGSEISCVGQLVCDAGPHRHLLRLELERREVANRENIYTNQNEELGRSYIRYLGEADVGNRTRQSATLLYTGQFGVKRELPVWQVTLDGRVEQRQILAVNYPDYRRQQLTWWHLRAEGLRHLLRGRNLWSCSLGADTGPGRERPARREATTIRGGARPSPGGSTSGSCGSMSSSRPGESNSRSACSGPAASGSTPSAALSPLTTTSRGLSERRPSGRHLSATGRKDAWDASSDPAGVSAPSRANSGPATYGKQRRPS